ncbi:class I SAM-dependent methyltransferase [Pseudomonas sp. App30]|uniref:class I SAM-dependent methyltransferase n=1 Tax=Pseudomonas sp. App30 TaxID=3068990 RepID=UPI003A80BF80
MAKNLGAASFELLFSDVRYLEMTPKRLTEIISWHEHIPFAFWLISKVQPSVFVELGVHKGDSYSAFCQAVEAFQLPTACYGVDTWKGEEHAGHYSEQVYEEFSAYHAEHYAGFSRLIRTTFDDALQYFEDGSVDLLHIDGRHGYEDVKYDFESWRPKLSDRAVVLFHDINVKEREFGVWKFFAELEETYPGKTFSFLHCNGLGVLVYGDKACAEAQELVALDDQARGYARRVFASLGKVIGKQAPKVVYVDPQLAAEREAQEAEFARVSAQAAAADAAIQANGVKDLEIQGLSQQVLDLKLRVRQVEIENYRAQFQLSCKVLEGQRALAEKDRQLAEMRGMAGAQLSAPVRSFSYSLQRVKHALRLMGPALYHGGGVRSTAQKALRLYKAEGFAGIKRGFRTVASIQTQQNRV